MSEQTQQAGVITLDTYNSSQILLQQIDISQKKGVFELDEADVLKRCKDLLLHGKPDTDLSVSTARQIIIQAVKKSQRGGAIESLEAASLLHKVCQYLTANVNEPLMTPAPAPAPVQEQQDSQPPSQPPSQLPSQPPSQPEEEEDEDDYDLEDLSAPVPLHPKIL